MRARARAVAVDVVTSEGGLCGGGRWGIGAENMGDGGWGAEDNGRVRGAGRGGREVGDERGGREDVRRVVVVVVTDGVWFG